MLAMCVRTWITLLLTALGFSLLINVMSVAQAEQSVRPTQVSTDVLRQNVRSPCHKMMIVKVVDGDTVYGYIDTSDPLIALRAKLRLRDIQSPEKGRRAQCTEERAKGREATQFLTSFLSPIIRKQSRSVARVCALGVGKYATRRIGRLEVRYDGQWVDVSELMLQSGMALPYFKRSRSSNANRQTRRRANGREMWCDCLKYGNCPRV